MDLEGFLRAKKHLCSPLPKKTVTFQNVLCPCHVRTQVYLSYYIEL